MIRLFKVAMSPDLTATTSPTASHWTNPLLATLASGYIGQGPRVDEFEGALQYAFQLPRAPVTLNSATSALDLALTLAGVGPGDAVVTTPQTCTATNSPIVTRGAFPIWADVNRDGLVTPASVWAAFWNAHVRGLEVKAVMVVDWAGARPNIPGIKALIGDIPVIEDAAHRLPGPSDADYCVWSFQAIKYLTTGDGGALLTPPDQLERAKLLRWYGLDREGTQDFRCEQDITEVGFKFHMNDIAATIGLANLPMAIANLARQRRNAAWLAKALGVRHNEASHYWFFPILVPDRDAFAAHLLERGIETSQVHARNDKHTAFPSGDLPGVDMFDQHQLALPCGWWLTAEDLDTIAEAALSFR